MEQKLRIGILLDSFELPAWKFTALQRIVNSGSADFSLVIVSDIPLEAQSSSWLTRQWKRSRSLFHRFYSNADKKAFLRPPNAFEPKDASALFSQVPTLQVKPIFSGEKWFLDPATVRKVQDYNLDVIIRMGLGSLCADLVPSARYGVWSCEAEDHQTTGDAPPGYWDTIDGLPATSTTLYMHQESSREKRILYSSSFFAFPFSPTRNWNTICWASSSFLPRQISLLHALGEEKFFTAISRYSLPEKQAPRARNRQPTNFRSISSSAKMITRIALELLRIKFSVDTWFLLYDLNPAPDRSFEKFKKIMPPKDRFWADPHIIEKDGKYYIFIEEYLFAKEKGILSVIEMDADGSYRNPVPVLEKEYHLSYPFVFQHDSKYYMIPETAQNRSIDLYECEAFPYRWKHKMTLMDNVRAVDTTLVYRDGKWWLFTGIEENAGVSQDVELFLFSADTLFTRDWKSHPLNPIETDVFNARPAGKLYSENGKLFRPSQDCSKVYGYSFNLNEIQCMSETEYREMKKLTVRPDWSPELMAAHTYNRVGNLTVIDAFTRRPKFFPR